MQYCTRRAARRAEPVKAHREFPRAQNAVRSRTRPQNTHPKDATFSFGRISFVPTDATARPTRRRRGRRLTMKYSTRRAAWRVEPVGAHREFPRAQNAMRSRPRPQNTHPKDADSWFERVSSVPTDATSRPTRRRRGRRLTMKYPLAKQLGVSSRSVLTVGSPVLKTPCARGHARTALSLRTSTLDLSKLRPCQPMRRVAPVDADKDERPR